MKFFSLYYKIISIFIITIFFSVGLIGWFGFKSTSDFYIDSTFEMNQQSSNSLDVEIEKKLEYVPKDALYSTNFYALKKYFVWKTMGDDTKAEMWKQIFSDALIDFLETRKDYFKVRIIDTDANEVISVTYDKNKDKTYLVPPNELQNKRGRAYVEKAKKLARGEFFISDMNLDIENHKIMLPHLPVIRFSTPIIDDNNELMGVFVTSVYADSVLDILKKHSKEDAKKNISYYLIDRDGNYLFNKNEYKMWNAQLHNGFNFNKDFFNIQEKFQNKEAGVFKEYNKIYAFHKVYPYKDLPETYWYIITVADTSVVFAKLDEFQKLFFFLFFLITLVSIYFIRLYILKITTPLTLVSQQLQALAQGEVKKEQIKYNAKDEVGEIVRSTIKVINAIEMTIEQANAVAKGDFSKDIKLLSKHDNLGSSIKEMTKRLKEITELATALSHGNYDVHVVSKGSEDKLGLALMNMVQYLKTITEIMESIALGNLDVQYTVKGSEDRLGRATLQMIKYLKNILQHANAISEENFSNSIEVKSSRDELGIALEKMTTILYQSSIKNKEEIYFSEGIGDFSDKITGISDIKELSKKALRVTAKYVDAVSGVIYVYHKERQVLSVMASYAYSGEIKEFYLGEGIVGQVALEKEEILLQNAVSAEYNIESGTTSSHPREVFVYPLLHDDELFGVCEMMSYHKLSDIQKDYLKKSATIFASLLHTTIQNIQIKELLKKSQNAFEELEKASKYKNEFLVNMSHELRTPLNSIILLSKLLSDNKYKNLTEKDVEKTKVINKAGYDLLMLINDILDLSKIESGNMELEMKMVNSVEIFDDIKGLFSVIADEKHLHFYLQDDYKDSFMSDKVKLLQVIKNLLSNAFKFTKEGSIILTLFKEENFLIFKVIDNGIGIPEDKCTTIFEAFKQVDGSISRKYGGTGLGLSISKTIVELMNGKLIVNSKLGEGSTFIVKIPLVKEQNNSIKVTSKRLLIDPIKESSMKLYKNIDFKDEIQEKILINKHFLLVDDDSRNIFALTSILESFGADVLSAFNLQEALDILDSTTNINLILIDMTLSIKEEIQVVQYLKDKEKAIVAIVSEGSYLADRKKLIASGVNDFVIKPIESKKLIATLRKILEENETI